MANYERMWNSLKRELQQLEEHYSDMRLNYAQKGQPTLAAQFKERGDGVAEAIMYMDLAEHAHRKRSAKPIHFQAVHSNRATLKWRSVKQLMIP